MATLYWNKPSGNIKTDCKCVKRKNNLVELTLKVFLLVFKALDDLGPEYITESVLFYNPARALRSSSASPLNLNNLPKKTIERSAFFFKYTPKLRYSIPKSPRDADSLGNLDTNSKPIHLTLLLTNIFVF